jgi:acyl-CoA thioesterase-2
MPDMPPPNDLPEWDFLPPGIPADVARRFRQSAVDIRACDPSDADVAEDDIPRRRVWMRVKGQLPEEEVLHAALLTYASDRGLIATARRGTSMMRQPGSAASLDHAIWFHRPPRFDDWVLYTSECPIAHAARALIFAQMHTRDGTRIASVVQEGLIRPPRPA